MSMGPPLKQAPLPPEPLRALVPTASDAAVDLLGRLLRFDPRKRASAEEALAHPYLADLHEEAAEPTAPMPFNLDFESDASLDWPQLRTMYCNIAAECHSAREARARAYEQQQQPGGGQPQSTGGQPEAAAGAGKGRRANCAGSVDSELARRETAGRRSADERADGDDASGTATKRARS